jgi:hypothetical protein
MGDAKPAVFWRTVVLRAARSTPAVGELDRHINCGTASWDALPARISVRISDAARLDRTVASNLRDRITNDRVVVVAPILLNETNEVRSIARPTYSVDRCTTVTAEPSILHLVVRFSVIAQ